MEGCFLQNHGYANCGFARSLAKQPSWGQSARLPGEAYTIVPAKKITESGTAIALSWHYTIQLPVYMSLHLECHQTKTGSTNASGGGTMLPLFSNRTDTVSDFPHNQQFFERSTSRDPHPVGCLAANDASNVAYQPYPAVRLYIYFYSNASRFVFPRRYI